MSQRVAMIAAFVGGTAWVAKIFIMWAAGGPNADSIFEAIAFFAGLIGVSVAGAAAGWSLAGRAATWQRVLALVLGFVVPMLVVGIVQGGLAAALPDAGWFRDESALLMVGVVALVLAAVAALAHLTRRQDRGGTSLSHAP